MRKPSLWMCLCILAACICTGATERQNNADYQARRTALAKQMEGGALVLFAPTEAEGPNNLYAFRQDDNFYYLTGWLEPGAALLINSNPYVEILFLAEHNVTQEKWTGPKLGPDNPQVRNKQALTKWKAWIRCTKNC
jgi:Xaa-Pro aminopeptidase